MSQPPKEANITRTLLGEPPADPGPAAGPDAHGMAEDGTGVEQSSVTRALAPAESGTTAEPERRYWHNVARLCMQVADALGYAAGQGVLHRDVKPSNLLLDTHGTVWITDFGLAKATEDGENLTPTGDLHGTLRYMAPERLEGRSDLRSDLYALGLTLYELLTLRPAFPATDRAQLLKQLAGADPTPPRQLDPRIPRDLETIILKLLARDPEQRYPTAAKLVDDLRRFMEDRPIRARRVTVGERLLQLPGGGRAGRALALAPDGRSLVTAGPDGASLRKLTVPEKLVLAGHTGGVPTVAISPGGKLLASGSKDRTVVLWDTATGRRLRTLPPFDKFVQSAAFSPDGRWLVTGDWGSGIKVWDVAMLRQVAAPAHRLGPMIFAVQFSGDGKYLAATGNGLQVGRLHPKEPSFTLEPVTFQPGSRSFYLQASADGRWLALVNHSTQLHLWDLKEQRERAVAAPPLLDGWHDLALHPEGRWVGCVSRDRVAEFWTLDPPSRAFTLGTPGEFDSYHVAASPDGR
ncbi:MAG TPA: serine/threonine-protein kinase [Gemmataceae bacterium]|nr:serine/threonine-protein kinase [Gemmataceae bacterium]